MASPTYATIIVQLTGQIDSLTQSFIYKGYEALSSALAKPLASLCILLITLLGYGILRGVIKMPLHELSKAALKIGFVYLLAMNWSLFSQYVVALFVDGASELGAALMQAAPNAGAVSHNINGALQSVFVEVIRVGAWTADKASFKHPSPLFTAIMIDLAGLVVIGFALFELIIAKIMLAICLCTAPLFLCLTLFEQTKSFFDRWLGTLVGFSLVLIFVSAVVGLCMHLIHWSIGDHYLNHAINVSAVDWIPIFLVAFLCIMLLLEVTGIAKSIGGACCTSNGSAMVGGFIGGALGAHRQGQDVRQKLGALAQKAVPNSLRSQLSQLKGNAQQQTFNGIRQRMRGHS